MVLNRLSKNMASSLAARSKYAGAKKSRCPACGGLKCLCRPRFFPGQLLTDEDLNLLDRYIVEKTRLHNRYLMGWGVVCGLEVVCHPCEDQLIVREGYAISPCGDDIVVCKDVMVPVCDLIQNCREKERRDRECEPYRPAGQSQVCDDDCQEWVLYIRYEEKPSRGVKPLRAGNGSQTNGNGCCSRCSGEEESCGCGCHAEPVGRNQAASRASRSSQCEPTQTCEGYRFEVSRKPKTGQDPRLDPQFDPSYRPGYSSVLLSSATLAKAKAGSALVQGMEVAALGGFRECYLEFLDAVPTPPQSDSTPEVRRTYCCNLKDALEAFHAAHPTYNCQIDELIAAIRCPALPQANNPADLDRFNQEYNQALTMAGRYLADYLKHCICSQFQPACPQAHDSGRVPLATVTVCGDSCQVVQVCNTDVRQILLAPATLQRFLDSTGLTGLVQTRLSNSCCPDLLEDVQVADFRSSPALETNMRYTARQAAYTRRGATSAAVHLWAQRDRPVTTFRLALSALGAHDEQGRLLVPEEALSNPESYVFASEVLLPALDALLPRQLVPMVQSIMREAAREAEKEEPQVPAVDPALKSEIETLRQVVAEQQQRIEELLKRLG